MPEIPKLAGTWRGRLVDVQGVEGELELTLKSGREGQVSGTFSVQIGGHHSTLRQRGNVEGKVTEKGLTLALVGKELPVKVSVTGEVLRLRDGGLGITATYEVSAKAFSPLQGGIVCASKDRKLEVDIASKREIA